MPTDILTQFKEKALQGTESKKRRSEILERIRSDAVALIAVASDLPQRPAKPNRLEHLLENLRVAVEKLKDAVEVNIATTLAMADAASDLWEVAWAEALKDPTRDRRTETEMVRWALTRAEESLREALSDARQEADQFERPVARLDELKARAAEFPVWARECLARWEMLDEGAPALDAGRIARARAAYARGEHEGLDEALSRVEAGGPWVKE